jgi:hypothetical protein
VIGFLQPVALVGLLAAALPPLLHLIGRRRPPTIVFPAVQYLSVTEREHSRRLKLRHLLLLVLRMVVIILLVLAAARPVATLGVGRAHAPTALALVLDNSLSAGAVADGRAVLDALAQRARCIATMARPGDRVWLVLADGTPQLLSRAALVAAIDSVGPSPQRLDLADAVRTAAHTVAAAELPQREVVVVSDLQASALAGPPHGAADVRVLVWAPTAGPVNRSVDTAYVEPEVWSPDGRVVAAIGGTASAPAAVRLMVEGTELGRAVGMAGERVVLDGRPGRSGWHPLRVELDADELRADDRWWLGVHVTEPVAARVDADLGGFVSEALDVLREGGRVRDGTDVLLSDRPGAGTTIVFPPDDPALVGALNRALAARAVGWRLGDRRAGAWVLDGELGPARGAAVVRRHRLEGTGRVLATAGGEPWLVRDGDVILVASRLTETWTELPVHAAFIPFIDRLLNRVAARESWSVRTSPGATLVLPSAVGRVLLPGQPVTVPGDRRFSAPLAAGVYFLAGAAGDTVGVLEVNYDRRESRLEPASEREIRAALGPEIQLLDGSAMVREVYGAARHADLAGALLAIALCAALLEMAVAAPRRKWKARHAADVD